jgi:hypothetical protein
MGGTWVAISAPFVCKRLNVVRTSKLLFVPAQSLATAIGFTVERVMEQCKAHLCTEKQMPPMKTHHHNLLVFSEQCLIDATKPLGWSAYQIKEAMEQVTGDGDGDGEEEEEDDEEEEVQDKPSKKRARAPSSPPTADQVVPFLARMEQLVQSAVDAVGVQAVSAYTLTDQFRERVQDETKLAVEAETKKATVHLRANMLLEVKNDIRKDASVLASVRKEIEDRETVAIRRRLEQALEPVVRSELADKWNMHERAAAVERERKRIQERASAPEALRTAQAVANAQWAGVFGGAK